jgi:hypothetical protein
MPKVHLYVSRADQAAIEALPAELTAAHLLRQALAERRAQAQACEHERVRVVCEACGAELEEGPRAPKEDRG